MQELLGGVTGSNVVFRKKRCILKAEDSARDKRDFQDGSEIVKSDHEVF